MTFPFLANHAFILVGTFTIIALCGGVLASTAVETKVRSGAIPNGVTIGSVEKATRTWKTGTHFVADTSAKVVVTIGRETRSTTLTLIAHETNGTFAMIGLVGLFDASGPVAAGI